MKKLSVFWICAASTVLLASCGMNKDPAALLQDSQDGAVVKTMSLPLSSSVAFTYTGAFAEGSQEFIRFSGAIQGVAVINPISGVIVENTGTSVTVRHNQAISVKVSGVTSTFRAGEYLNTGDGLGVVNATAIIDFTVYNNGSAICPLSLLDKTNRTLLLTKTSNASPCLP
jgi:hypothetical protein